MNKESVKFIKDNRFKMSMIDMGLVLSISYNKVRSYMMANNLMLTKQQVNDIKKRKRSRVKKWDYDALP